MDFKCKYCGSVNLELEEKGNQTGLYCCDCGKWLKWVTKEEKRVFNNKNACTPIYVPKGATNGDVFKVLFPNCRDWKSGIKDNGGEVNEVHFVLLPNSMIVNRYDESWWNAPYKAEKGDSK